MIVKVFRDDILEGLQKSAAIIPSKAGAAYLRTIWLQAGDNRLTIMATDSNLEFCGAYKAEILEDGLAGVQGRAFYDLVRKLPAGEITLKLKDKNLNVTQGSRTYKLPINDPDWFQGLAEFPEDGSVIWTGDVLAEIIDKVAYCISDEDAMEAIACMNMVSKEEAVADETSRYVEICGLNGHQFAMARVINDDIADLLPESGLLLQKKYVIELKKWLTTEEVELSLDAKRLFCRTVDKGESFSLPLSFYQYPDYQGFLNKVQADDGTSTLLVDRVEMLDSLERIQIFNTETNKCVNFHLADAELNLTAQGQEVGHASESLAIEYKGSLDKIAFPTRNLLEILGHMNSAKVQFVFTGPEGPCGVSGKDDSDYLVVIMPMKIVEETYFSEEGN